MFNAQRKTYWRDRGAKNKVYVSQGFSKTTSNDDNNECNYTIFKKNILFHLIIALQMN